MRAAGAWVLAAVSVGPVFVSAQKPPLDAVLRLSGAYLAEYEGQVGSVISEEHYTQMRRGGSAASNTRVLKSDILVINAGEAGWFGFRDVYEVDGHSVRDHTARLLALVTAPVADSLDQARRLTDESARFNLGDGVRTLNMPTTALIFLRRTEQARSTWTMAGDKRIAGRPTVELRFAEQTTPRMIRTGDGAAARGRFWIEPDSGRIVRSELSIDSMGMQAVTTVTFGPVPNVEPWVPLTMEDSYRWTSRDSGEGSRMASGGGLIEGHATYRNFRTFTVETSMRIKK
jgi:hypothetical protein